jgi:hypothetical protein
MQHPSITIPLSEGSISLPVTAIAAALAQSVISAPRAEVYPSNTLIGRHLPGQGGIYAGIMRGRDGAPDYHLVVGPEIEGRMNWEDAKHVSTKLNVDGFQDFTLPYRKEQALLFANVPELFDEAWYWSCEQRAGSSAYAWAQDFNDGDQDVDLKASELRARAVRRLPIQ